MRWLFSQTRAIHPEHIPSSIPHQSCHWLKKGGHWQNFFLLPGVELERDCTHNREHRVHSISHRADEIYTPHLHTCMPYRESSFPVPLPVVFTHMLAPPGPPLPLLLVSTHVPCSLIPGSSLAAAHYFDSRSSTPSSSLAAAAAHHPWLLSCCCLLFWLTFLHPLVCVYNGLSHGVGWLLLFSHPWLLSCCRSLFWLTFSHPWVLSCCCLLFWLVFLHTLVLSCWCSLLWLMF